MKINAETRILIKELLIDIVVAGLMIICIILICGCHKTIHVKVTKGSLELPDLQVEKENIKLYNFDFSKNKNNICLNKDNQMKLLQNINNIKIAYYKTFEKYKLAVENYNELKKIAYQS